MTPKDVPVLFFPVCGTALSMDSKMVWVCLHCEKEEI